LSAPLDRDFLDELIDGDREFGGQLFLAFEEASDNWLGQASEACRTGDHEQASRAFHTLKGSAASVGLTLVRDLARDLEGLAKQNDLQACSPRIADLEVKVREGRTLLADFLACL
jgi:two-component system sensor histidine kinase/response regulator